MEHIGMHAQDCPIGPGCPTCQQEGPPPALAIRASAYHRGRHRDAHGCVTRLALVDVARWLRIDAHESGWVRSEGQRQCLALWLIALRDRLEARRWGLG